MAKRIANRIIGRILYTPKLTGLHYYDIWNFFVGLDLRVYLNENEDIKYNKQPFVGVTMPAIGG